LPNDCVQHQGAFGSGFLGSDCAAQTP
jgi:hypothetical protein